MTIEQLISLKNSSEAPYNHDDYTIWLHNKIIEKIRYDLWEFREREAIKISNGYAACNKILSLSILEIAK